MTDQVIFVSTYDGTLESARMVLRRLRIEDDVYHFNIMTSELILIKFGLILRPGDCYQYRELPPKFEAIG